MEIINGFWDALKGIYQGSGLMNLDWRNYLMIGIACVLFFLAIKKQFEPLLLLPFSRNCRGSDNRDDSRQARRA